MIYPFVKILSMNVSMHMSCIASTIFAKCLYSLFLFIKHLNIIIMSPLQYTVHTSNAWSWLKHPDTCECHQNQCETLHSYIFSSGYATIINNQYDISGISAELHFKKASVDSFHDINKLVGNLHKDLTF